MGPDGVAVTYRGINGVEYSSRIKPAKIELAGKVAHSYDEADMILLVKGGRIVERGKHEDLLRAGGLYATLYDLQFHDEDEISNLTLTGTAA